MLRINLPHEFKFCGFFNYGSSLASFSFIFDFSNIIAVLYFRLFKRVARKQMFNANFVRWLDSNRARLPSVTEQQPLPIQTTFCIKKLEKVDFSCIYLSTDGGSRRQLRLRSFAVLVLVSFLLNNHVDLPPSQYYSKLAGIKSFADSDKLWF